MARRSAARPAVAFDPNRPPRIDGLTEFKLIGRGGFSTVWRAKQSSMGRTVAVKLVDAPLADPQALARFQLEAERAGKLGEHPSIATVHSWGEVDGRPYLVMQFYSRGSMKDRLNNGPAFTVAEVLAFGVQIAGALKYAHDQNIVHRDVKPENILQDNVTGQAVLTDFGIAADHSAGPPGDPRGMTVPYAPPELLRGTGVWPGSDVWSLAATLYTLLAGRPPYTDFSGREEPWSISERALSGPLPALGPEVPAEVFAVLESALVGPLDTRTSWASPFAQRLNDAQRALGLEPTPLLEMPAPEAAPPQQSNKSSNGWATLQDPAEKPTLDDQSALAAGTAGQTSLTSLAGSGFHFAPEQVPAPERFRPPWKVIAIGGACGLALASGIYFATGRGSSAPSSRTATAPGASASAGPTPTADPSSRGASAPKPPLNVAAVPVSNGSAVRLSWTDTAAAGQYQVVVSLGHGYTPRVVPDQSPQVISGLVASRPYCFAVGYLYSLDGAVSYSAAVCIRGGIAG